MSRLRCGHVRGLRRWQRSRRRRRYFRAGSRELEGSLRRSSRALHYQPGRAQEKKKAPSERKRKSNKNVFECDRMGIGKSEKVRSFEGKNEQVGIEEVRSTQKSLTSSLQQCADLRRGASTRSPQFFSRSARCRRKGLDLGRTGTGTFRWPS